MSDSILDVNNLDRDKEREEIRSLICQLQGVISADVSYNGQDEIQEIHVLANFDRSPKQVVRDIESILVTKRGLRLDHKKISVAQISGNGYIEEKTSRIQFLRVGVSLSGLENKVEVELLKSGIPSLGTAEGPSSEMNQLRLIVEATLRAINNYLNSKHTFVMEGIKILTEGKDIILVTITALTPRDERKLVGSAFCEGDRNKIIVFATLDAINRYLEKWQKFSNE